MKLDKKASECYGLAVKILSNKDKKNNCWKKEVDKLVKDCAILAK